MVAALTPPLHWHAPLSALPAAALALLHEASRDDVYRHPAWLANLAQTVAFAPLQPRYAVLQRAGAPRVLLPLLWPGGGAGPGPRRARSLANYYSPLAHPASAIDASADDWRQLCLALRQPQPGAPGAAGRIDSLQLGPLDLASPQAQALQQGLADAGWRTRPYFCFGNWHHRLPAGGAERWAGYWAGRDGALRNTAARMGRRFARAGGRFEIITGPAGLDAALAAYEQVYAHSWKGAEPHPGFLPGLARAAAAQGWLRLGLAWLGPQPVAAQLWLVQPPRASIYKLAYREDAASYSPGTLLTAELLQQVLADPAVREIDYGMGDEPYKRQWMDQRRERWGLEALNPATLRGQALRLQRALAGWRRAAAPPPAANGAA